MTSMTKQGQGRLSSGWYWTGQAAVGTEWSSSGWYGNEFGGIASSMRSG
jgi:hypothetical protein